MQIVACEIAFSDDAKAIIHDEMATGRYVYEDEMVTAALYLLLQDLANRGEAPSESGPVLRRPLGEMLAELGQSLDERFGRLGSSPNPC